MKKRIISTIALWGGIFLILKFTGTTGGLWLLIALALATQYELYSLMEDIGYFPLGKAGITCGLIIMLSAYYLPSIGYTTGATDILILSIIIITAISMQLYEKDSRFDAAITTLFGIIYIPYLFQFYIRIIKVYEIQDPSGLTGIFIIIWLIAVAKFTDVGAYLVGSRWGRTKLARTISPNKTWEGAVGGVLVAMLIGLILYLSFKAYFPENFTIGICLLISLPIAIISILSDLMESVIKRRANVKDSGHIIPGIGGAFDLTDSLVLTAPTGYVLLKYLVF